MELESRRGAAARAADERGSGSADARRGRVRVRRRAAPDRGARIGRRSGAERGVRGRQCRHGASPRDGARDCRPGADGGADRRARSRRPRPSGRSGARGGGARRRRPTASTAPAPRSTTSASSARRRESELAGARSDREASAHALRTAEHELASLQARLHLPRGARRRTRPVWRRRQDGSRRISRGHRPDGVGGRLSRG